VTTREAVESEGKAGTPVVKRTAIGQTFKGCIINTQQRDVLKDGAPAMNERGKPRQELVIRCIVAPGTTAPAGIGDDVSVPAPGDEVRLILRGKAFADWIEGKRQLGGSPMWGDLVTQTTVVAQAYDANGKPKGGEIHNQAEIDALPRSTSVGIYGPLTLERTDEHGPLAAYIAQAGARFNAYKNGERAAADTHADVSNDPF
jgi:hypothetical protein